jgi:hypothetical protein
LEIPIGQGKIWPVLTDLLIAVGNPIGVLIEKGDMVGF